MLHPDLAAARALLANSHLPNGTLGPSAIYTSHFYFIAGKGGGGIEAIEDIVYRAVLFEAWSETRLWLSVC
jgi:hypothetical protein